MDLLAVLAGTQTVLVEAPAPFETPVLLGIYILLVPVYLTYSIAGGKIKNRLTTTMLCGNESHEKLEAASN